MLNAGSPSTCIMKLIYILYIFILLPWLQCYEALPWPASSSVALSRAPSYASVRMATAYTAPTTGLALGQSGAPQQEPCQSINQPCVQSTPFVTCRKPPHRSHIIKIAHGNPPPFLPPRSRQSKHPLQQLLPLRAVPHCCGPSQPIQLGYCACSTHVKHIFPSQKSLILPCESSGGPYAKLLPCVHTSVMQSPTPRKSGQSPAL